MTLGQDIKYATRAMRRRPGLVAVAIVSIALGIGANALVFGTARGLLLRPLPIPQPDQVFYLQAGRADNHSYPNYIDLRDRSTNVAALAAYRVVEAAIDSGNGARSSWGYLASGNYFEMLGVRPALGGFFSAGEDVGRNAAPFIVLAFDFWRTSLGADGSIAGRVIRVTGQPFTVKGVAPEGFHGTEVFFRPDYWIPMTMAPQVEGSTWIDSRTAHNVYVAGRLTDGVPTARAQAALSEMARQLSTEYPAANRTLSVTITTIGLFGEVVRGPATTFALATLVLAFLVLLAACTNLANLLAARVMDRYKELAVRLSLGATRRRVARQLFVETLLLCGVGGLAGMGLAGVLLRALTLWRPAVGLPLAVDVRPDLPVIFFAALATIGSAIVAVLAAAHRAWHTDPSLLLRGGSGPVHGGRWTFRDGLLALQVCLCALLVVASVVAIRGLLTTTQTRLGFNPDGLFVASFDLNQRGYTREQGASVRAAILDRVAAMPSVEAVTFTSSVPLTTDQSTDSVMADSTTDADAEGVTANAFSVPAGYFEAMGTRMMRGREFAPTDGRAVVINETLAQRLFGRTDVVGRGLKWAVAQRPAEIVGVVEDGKYALPGETPRAAIFRFAGPSYLSSTQLLVRSSLPMDQVADLTRRGVAAVDADLTVTFQGSIQNVTSLAFLPARAAATILSALGLIAVVLALSGTYGVASYAVSSRVRDIGIRVALGGRAGQVLATVLGRTAMVLVGGAALGVLVAVVISPLLSMVVYQATSRDVLTLTMAACVIVLVGLAAVAGPAWRTLRVDPSSTLRES
jgi:predicted permease